MSIDDVISAVQRVELKPGEMLAVMCPGHVSSEDSEIMSEKLKRIVPAGVTVAIFTEGIQIKVVSAEEAA